MLRREDESGLQTAGTIVLFQKRSSNPEQEFFNTQGLSSHYYETLPRGRDFFMYTLRTKLAIAGLLVVIAASVVSVVGHVDVLWSPSISIQKEAPAPIRSLVLQSTTSGTAARPPVVYQASTTPEGPFITLVAGDKIYRTVATSTQTILSVMRTLEKTDSLSFGGREFPSMGFFVEEIDHKRNAGGYYWMLYVNMLAAPKGVSQMMVSPGDQILWRYEKNRHQ